MISMICDVLGQFSPNIIMERLIDNYYSNILIKCVYL